MADVGTSEWRLLAYAYADAYADANWLSSGELSDYLVRGRVFLLAAAKPGV